MSRSRRHTPACGCTTARSEKSDKQIEHRRLRSNARDALSTGDYERAEYDRRDSIWRWAKDGKQWFAGLRRTDAPYYRRLMRK